MTLRYMHVAWTLLTVLILTACGPMHGIECAGPGDGLSPEECEDVAGHVVAVKPAVAGHQLGDLQLVSVELIECSPLTARQFFDSELAAPTAERCWSVRLSYEGGELTRIVIRDFSGNLAVR